jgi:ribosomal protein S18 acetylase RimI-like enzyme
LPSYRRRGIGSQLLHRAEAYLRQRGASTLLFGSQSPNNPFLFGLQGGCTNVGVVLDEEATTGFLQRHHYVPHRELGIYRRSLARLPLPMDSRFGSIRGSFDIIACGLRHTTWWQESILGPIDAVEYRLQDRATGAIPAQMVLWDMDTFCMHWGESCVGLMELSVLENWRRLGLGKYLLFNVLRHLRERSFAQFEATADPADPAMLGLLRSLEFERVGAGLCYRKASA